MKTLSLFLLFLASNLVCNGQILFPPGQSDAGGFEDLAEPDTDMFDLLQETDEVNIDRLYVRSNWEDEIEGLQQDIQSTKAFIRFFEDQNQAIAHDLIWLQEQAKVRRYESASLHRYIENERFAFEADQIELQLEDQDLGAIPSYSGDANLENQLYISHLNDNEHEEISNEILNRQRELIENAFIIDLYEVLIDESEEMIRKYEL